MRGIHLRCLLGLALLAATEPAMADVRMGGQLGLSLEQRNDWSAATSLSRRSYWFTGSLHLDAGFFTPGTLEVGGTASYQGYRAVGGSASDALNYQLRLSALGQTPFNLSASAMRTTTDFTADRDSGRVGTTRVDGISGTASLRLTDGPYLSTTLRNTSISTTAVGSAPVKSDTTGFTAEAAQSVDWLNYNLTYERNWSSGDYAETNYENHFTQLRTYAQLAPGLTAQVAANYTLRMPTTTSPLNPRIDNQGVSTWLQWMGDPELTGGGGYNFSDSLVAVPGEAIRQSTVHSLNAYGSRQINRDFAVDLNASASASEVKANGAELDATGEQAGAGLRWSRVLGLYQAQATVTGSFGGYQASGAANTRAWGTGASASLSRPIGAWSTTGSLSGSYDENTGASAGSRTRATGVLGASGQPWGWSVINRLTCGYSRSESPTFGAGRALNLTLESTAMRGGYTLTLNAGVTDDLAEALVPGGASPGSLVPVDFNSQSRFVYASATVPTVARLYLSAAARVISLTSPGRGEQWEAGVSLSAHYYIGAFQFSLYDSLTSGGSVTGTGGTQNVLFLSVTRSFGR